MDAIGQLLMHAQKIQNKHLKKACKKVLDHPSFKIAFGGTTHHNYAGGLAWHTLEVVDYAVKMAKMFPTANLDVIRTAVIFHDFMKIKDYDIDTGKPTQYRFWVRHLSGSHAEFMKAIDGMPITDKLQIEIQHAMLAHHGRQEYGSPIEPQSVEAHIIHYADNLSKHFGPRKSWKT